MRLQHAGEEALRQEEVGELEAIGRTRTHEPAAHKKDALAEVGKPRGERLERGVALAALAPRPRLESLARGLAGGGCHVWLDHRPRRLRVFNWTMAVLLVAATHASASVKYTDAALSTEPSGHSGTVEPAAASHTVAKISTASKKRLEMKVSDAEIRRAIRGMARGKAPGPDGLGAEFYKEFEDLIALDLSEPYSIFTYR